MGMAAVHNACLRRRETAKVVSVAEFCPRTKFPVSEYEYKVAAASNTDRARCACVKPVDVAVFKEKVSALLKPKVA